MAGILALVFIFLTFLILLVTSSYSISTIILYRKSMHLKKSEAIIHVLLQLVFVLDVFDAIYLYAILSKFESMTSEDMSI